MIHIHHAPPPPRTHTVVLSCLVSNIVGQFAVTFFVCCFVALVMEPRVLRPSGEHSANSVPSVPSSHNSVLTVRGSCAAICLSFPRGEDWRAKSCLVLRQRRTERALILFGPFPALSTRCGSHYLACLRAKLTQMIS